MFLYDKYRLRKVVDLHRFPNMLALFTIRLMLANIRRRISADSLTDLNPWIPRDAALSNVTRLRICCMSLASCSESGTESTEKSASVHHCVRCASAPGSTLALWSDASSQYRSTPARWCLLWTRSVLGTRVRSLRTLYGRVWGPRTRVTSKSVGSRLT